MLRGVNLDGAQQGVALIAGTLANELSSRTIVGGYLDVGLQATIVFDSKPIETGKVFLGAINTPF